MTKINRTDQLLFLPLLMLVTLQAAAHEHEDARARLNEQKPRLPSRSRISVSATVEQLSDVGSGKLSQLEFTRQAQVRVFSPKK